MTPKARCFLITAVFLAGAGGATAQPVMPPSYPEAPSCADLAVQYSDSADPIPPCAGCGPDWFAVERFSLEALVGGYASTSAIGSGTPSNPVNGTTTTANVDVDYVPIDLRLGYRPFLPERRGGPRLCEQLTLLLDVQIAPQTRGAGNIIVGPIALLRYDFLPASCRLIPYIQGGVGFVYNDEYKDLNQQAVGKADEIQAGVQAGLRWRFADHWSADLEGGYETLTNGGMATRNSGLNSLGASFGFTYTFGSPCRR